MAAVCSGRPTRGQQCDAKPARNPVVLAAVDAVRNFLARTSTPTKSANARVSTQQLRRVAVAEKYIAARLAGRNDDVLKLVSEDIELRSSRDGTHAGKRAFSQYLQRVKPTGTWKPATWNRAIDKAEILGNVKILMLNVGVVAHLAFDRRGKINRIYVGTRGKAQK